MEVSRVDKVVVTVARTTLLRTAMQYKVEKWVLNSCCLKHTSNNRLIISNFVECDRIFLASTNKRILLHGVWTITLVTILYKKHYITICNVLYTPDIIHKLI